MALIAKHKDCQFGVGDTVRIVQKIKEGGKRHLQSFEGMVIGIKGRGINKSFTVRRVGAAQIGIERIFPLESPLIEKVEVVRHGTRGVKRAKLYYIRGKARREIEQIYSRASRREKAKAKKAAVKKKAVKRKLKKNKKTSGDASKIKKKH